MNDSSARKHKHSGLLVAKIVSIASFVLLAVLLVAQIYTRWAINQNFTFLGGFELEALTVATFALLFGIAYLDHRDAMHN